MTAIDDEFAEQDAKLRARCEAVRRLLAEAREDTRRTQRELDDAAKAQRQTARVEPPAAPENEAATTPAAEDAAERLEDLRSRTKDAGRRASGDGSEYLRLTAEMADLERERLASAPASEESSIAVAEERATSPGLRVLENAVALYRDIAKIAWAPDAGDGVIAGSVHLDDAHCVKRFRIDTTTKTPFEVAEELGLAAVALPAVSCGVFGYPLADAARIGTRAAVASNIDHVEFVLFSDDLYDIFATAAEDACGPPGSNLGINY